MKFVNLVGYKRQLIVVSYLLSTLIMKMNLVQAENIGKIIHKSEIPLRTEREAAILPLAVAIANNGGLIVAGSISATKQGWATKLGADHQVVWTYYRELYDEDKPAFANQLVRPTYRGIAPMPDGSVFLCGHMPHPPHSNVPSALLTHLDTNGKVLNERLIAPQISNINHDSFQFDACTRWGNGIVIIGHEMHIRMPNDINGVGYSTTYWLLVLDASGRIKWEKQISTLFNTFFPDPRGIMLLATDKGFIFSATDNVNTEVASVNANGELQAQRKFVGRFLLIHPSNPHNPPQIYGSFTSNTMPPRVVVTLNEKLEDVQTIQGDKPSDFAASRAFQMPDQSLLLIGANIHSSRGSTSGVRHVDRLLQTEWSLDIDNKSGFFDAGTIEAGSPTQIPNEFVTARGLVAKDENNKNIGGNEADIKRGGRLNFLQFNN